MIKTDLILLGERVRDPGQVWGVARGGGGAWLPLRRERPTCQVNRQLSEHFFSLPFFCLVSCLYGCTQTIYHFFLYHYLLLKAMLLYSLYVSPFRPRHFCLCSVSGRGSDFCYPYSILMNLSCLGVPTRPASFSSRTSWTKETRTWTLRRNLQS